jgi:hypothetical protein
VSCEGGASAEAYAKALSQAIQKDKATGCDVLVTAQSYAYAKCGPSGAFAEAGSSITMVRLTFGYLDLSTRVCLLASAGR